MCINLHKGLFDASDSPKIHWHKFRNTVWIWTVKSLHHSCYISAEKVLSYYLFISIEYICFVIVFYYYFHCLHHQVKQNNCCHPRLNRLIREIRVRGMSVGWTVLWQVKGKRTKEKSHSASHVRENCTHCFLMNEPASPLTGQACRPYMYLVLFNEDQKDSKKKTRTDKKNTSCTEGSVDVLVRIHGKKCRNEVELHTMTCTSTAQITSQLDK